MILQNRVAFVTAAGAGIGRAGALAMAAEGATVVVTDLKPDTAQETAAMIAATGGKAEAAGLDVTDDAALIRAITGAAQRHRGLDILHSHAGIQIPGRLDHVTVDQMDASWRVNVRAHLVAAKAAMEMMQPQGRGSIIITASNSGVQFDREMIAHATTKHAVIAMTKQIAVTALATIFAAMRFAPALSTRLLTQGSSSKWAAARHLKVTSNARSRCPDLAPPGPVAVWCRSFDGTSSNKGDELWDQAERMNSARMRCALR